ncbi:MAG TPA: hypothetical protein VF518_14305, partial [Polyangia bacterium]
MSELVAMLQAAAQPVRIEVIAPGTTDSSAGEVHLLAGGMAEAFAGSLRRDDAMAALQRLEGARYLIECRLPNPESGSLSEPGPHDGSLKDRPLASLMRYCEEYVLTCRLEAWRGQDRAVISYRRGEIIGASVGGSEGSDRLPEVLGWNDGAYEIILAAPVLPQMPSRGRDGAGARAERKRHATLPMIPGSEAKPDVQDGSQTSGAATAPPARPGSAQPAQSAIPTGGPGALPPSTTLRPAQQPDPQAHKTPARQQPTAAVTPRPVAVTFASPLQPEVTTRGTPPVPAVPLVPVPAPQPAARPTTQGMGVPLVQSKPAKPAKPAKAKAIAPASLPAPQPSQKPVAPRSSGVPLQKPAAAQPAPQAPQKPVPAQAPQLLQKPPAVPLSVHPTLQPSQKPAPPEVQPAPKPNPPAQADAAAPVTPAAAQPPAQAASQAEKPQAAPARPSKPASSNDLMPASGTIEAKPK